MTYRVPRRRDTAEHSGLAQKNPSPSFSLIPGGILRVSRPVSCRKRHTRLSCLRQIQLTGTDVAAGCQA